MVVLPTLLAGAYWYGVAADRFVSEFRYSVRSGAAMAEGGGGGPMRGGGSLVFASDSFVLEDYLASEAALIDVAAAINLRAILGRDGGDPVRAYDAEAPLEDLMPHWERAVRPRFDAVTGITTVTVSLYSPEDTRAVGDALVEALSALVDGLSAEARREMMAFVDQEYADAVAEVAQARRRIETFRRETLMISPDEEVAIGSTILADLANQISEAQVSLRALIAESPGSPRIAPLQNRIRALEAQLAEQTSQRGGETPVAGDTLPEQLTVFDALRSDYAIAEAHLMATRTLRQEAEAFATLGQAELVVFVPPRTALASTEPRRWLETLKTFGIAFAVWLVLRIILASLRA